MSQLLDKVRIVILNCPYNDWSNKQVQSMFGKMVQLKLDGYKKKHSFGVLPVDETDYIATHPLICIEDGDELIPISGSKVISYSTCEAFNVGFAMKSCLEKARKTEHLYSLFKILEEAQKKNSKICYHGGYTISPSYRNDKEVLELLKELFIASSVLYFKSNGIKELLGIGVPQFKTDDFFYNWGYKKVNSIEGQDLENFPLYFLKNIDGVMMHLNSFSNEVLKIALKYEKIWSNRLELSFELESEDNLKEAA
jgi:hypothetical protein